MADLSNKNLLSLSSEELISIIEEQKRQLEEQNQLLADQAAKIDELEEDFIKKHHFQTLLNELLGSSSEQ